MSNSYILELYSYFDPIRQQSSNPIKPKWHSIIMVVLMEDNFIRLSTFRIYGNKIEIYDGRKRQIVEVRIVDGLLTCSNCKTDECIHIGYALGIKEQIK